MRKLGRSTTTTFATFSIAWSDSRDARGASIDTSHSRDELRRFASSSITRAPSALGIPPLSRRRLWSILQMHADDADMSAREMAMAGHIS